MANVGELHVVNPRLSSGYRSSQALRRTRQLSQQSLAVDCIFGDHILRSRLRHLPCGSEDVVMRRVLWLILGLAIAVLAGFSINMITESSGSSELWSITAAAVSGLAGLITAALAFRSEREAVRYRRWVYGVVNVKPSDTQMIGDHLRITVRGRASSEPAQILVDQIAELEVDAQSVLDRVLGGRNRTIFDLRADLAHAGIWTSSDVEDFDRAVRVRNAAVHGDLFSEKDVTNASKTCRAAAITSRRSIGPRHVEPGSG